MTIFLCILIIRNFNAVKGHLVVGCVVFVLTRELIVYVFHCIVTANSWCFANWTV